MDDKLLHDIVNFLLNNGFKATTNEKREIEEIVVNETGEKLHLEHSFFIENEFFSEDRNIKIIYDKNGIEIMQNRLEVKFKNSKLEGERKISVHDRTTDTYLSMSYETTVDNPLRYPMYEHGLLAGLFLYMSSGDANEHLMLVQDMIGTYVDVENEIEGENSEQCFQIIMQKINECKYIISNPMINTKLNLIQMYAKDFSEKLVNAKYSSNLDSETAIKFLEQRRFQEAKKIEKAEKIKNRCDVEIEKIKKGKKL